MADSRFISAGHSNLMVKNYDEIGRFLAAFHTGLNAFSAEMCLYLDAADATLFRSAYDMFL
jgi:hypothetical protein